MDRLIAYRANEPGRLRAALLLQRPVLFPEVPDEALLSEGQAAEEKGLAAEANVQLRWGIGYYVGGEPHVQRFFATFAQGFAALKALRADVVIAQVGAQGTTAMAATCLACTARSPSSTYSSPS